MSQPYFLSNNMLFKTSERVCTKVLFLPVMNENVFGPPNVHLCSCLSIHLSICRRSLIPLRTDDAPTHEWTYKGIELPSIRRRAPPRPPASHSLACLLGFASFDGRTAFENRHT